MAIGGGVVAFAVAGAIVLVVVSPFPDAGVRTTRTPAIQLRRAAEMWRGQHRSDECPTPERLKQDGAVDPAGRLDDQWGSPFRIICETDETIVLSLGPDRKERTADDIRVPEQVGAR